LWFWNSLLNLLSTPKKQKKQKTNSACNCLQTIYIHERERKGTELSVNHSKRPYQTKKSRRFVWTHVFFFSFEFYSFILLWFLFCFLQLPFESNLIKDFHDYSLSYAKDVFVFAFLKARKYFAFLISIQFCFGNEMNAGSSLLLPRFSLLASYFALFVSRFEKI